MSKQWWSWLKKVQTAVALPRFRVSSKDSALSEQRSNVEIYIFGTADSTTDALSTTYITVVFSVEGVATGPVGREFWTGIPGHQVDGIGNVGVAGG